MDKPREAAKSAPKDFPKHVEAVIIGSGHSGICMGYNFKKAGLDDFLILEKASHIGGTWRENIYPGSSCDTYSHWYQYSFSIKNDWSRTYAMQPEILATMEQLAEKFGLYPHCRYNAEVLALKFNDNSNTWTIELKSGVSLTANIVITGVGQLHRPSVPNFPGKESFEGRQFHSAEWDSSFSSKGKKVAVIGSGASAAQIVPAIAPDVERLFVLQRSPNYHITRGDRTYPGWLIALFTWFPFLVFLHYLWSCLFIGDVLLMGIMKQNPFFVYIGQLLFKATLNSQIQDPELRQKLTPTYPIGFKRILFTDYFYPALTRDNVSLETEAIARITPKGIELKSGKVLEVDAIVYATGFKSTDFLSPIKITGHNSKVLHEEWTRGARAYLGVAVSGFPNFFVMYGPNTNLGHGSMLSMIEAQGVYITDLYKKMRAQGIKAVEVKKSVQEAYNSALQADLAKTAWAAEGKSWYKTDEGLITNNWPYTTTYYRWLLWSANVQDYDVSS